MTTVYGFLSIWLELWPKNYPWYPWLPLKPGQLPPFNLKCDWILVKDKWLTFPDVIVLCLLSLYFELNIVLNHVNFKQFSDFLFSCIFELLLVFVSFRFSDFCMPKWVIYWLPISNPIPCVPLGIQVRIPKIISSDTLITRVYFTS